MEKNKLLYGEIENKNKINKMNNEIENIDKVEDNTQYGEFVSSYFAWLTLEKQKKNTKKMENMTDK